eukprot:TRINITY_DN867_c0_g1_i5.p2 TRINITY_DN867_c0_g1~~TRINITY_DN867_c0_g1_i5.p2  ORF type:complete len:226 (-),score=85.22 TRINITY_DN867_c0_g1_i5:230-826(-)
MCIRDRYQRRVHGEIIQREATKKAGTMSLVYEKPNDFKFIHRVFNTNIDGRRKLAFALRGIKGIGRRFAHVVVKKARLNVNQRAGELSENDLQKIQDIIIDPVANGIPKWFLNRQRDFKDGTWSQSASNILDTRLRDDLERMKKIRCHRGLRHYWGLRVRGQHTKTTGRRGATVGVERKKKQKPQYGFNTRSLPACFV